MTVFMVTHDLKEGFELGTRLLVFDKLRHDPQGPEAYGAKVTYDIPLRRLKSDRQRQRLALAQAAGSEAVVRSYGPDKAATAIDGGA